MVIRLSMLAMAVLLCIPVLSAQTAGSDPIRELLTEVRGLRAALERAATIGTRVQLFVARMQLQEQRLAELSRRAGSVRSELRSVDADALSLGTVLKQMEEALGRASAEEHRPLETEIAAAKTRLGILERRRQELASDDAQTAQEIAVEQGRWTAINDQLEQLERSLAQQEPK